MTTCPRPDKIRHPTPAAARAHARALRRNGGSPDIQAYPCVCGTWHAGHNLRSLQQRIRRALHGQHHRRRVA